MGEYQDLQFYNRPITENYDPLIYSHTRWSTEEKLIIVANFSSEKASSLN
jgi:hypothetical protein